jgi:hypothetical protein
VEKDIKKLKMVILSIGKTYKPNGKLSKEQIYLLCHYKRELDKLEISHDDVEIENESIDI